MRPASEFPTLTFASRPLVGCHVRVYIYCEQNASTKNIERPILWRMLELCLTEEDVPLKHGLNGDAVQVTSQSATASLVGYIVG